MAAILDLAAILIYSKSNLKYLWIYRRVYHIVAYRDFYHFYENLRKGSSGYHL